MNVHLIRENENQNDGSYIHLYRNKQIGAWCAYGYSAYGLRLFDKQQGYMNFRSYSDCLQMPCTVTSGESLVSLLQGSVEVGSQTETYIKLKMADTINFNAYQKWLHKLKKDDPNDDALPKGYNRLLIVFACLIIVYTVHEYPEKVNTFFFTLLVEIITYIATIWIYRGFKELP